MTRKKPASPAAGTHTVHEDMPWTENVNDHPARADSPAYIRSRKLMIALVKLCQPWVYGPPPYQDHHGGGVWLKDSAGWQLVLGLVGSEWSAQFCLDPVKVDAWRIRTKRLVSSFPETIPGYVALGYPDGQTLLETPVTDATTIGLWVDGIFNASVPLPAGNHTGVLGPGKQDPGEHHYPMPIAVIPFIKHDDFILFQTDPASKTPVAVAPVAARGAGDGRVQVLYATPGTALHKKLVSGHSKGKPVILPASHPLAKKAFAKQ